MKIFDDSFQLIERSLDYSAKKNEAISNNIANVDTPNYKAKKIVFKDVLSEAVTKQDAKRTHPKHYEFTQDHPHFQTITQRNTVYNHNRNNVDIDKEMSNLAQNQIYYRSLIDRINGKFQTLSTIVKGGR